MIDDWASYALADFVPFTAEVYARLVERINAAWWPLHPLFVVLGFAALALAWRGRTRPALLLLASAWASCGIVFHLGYYAELTWAAPWLGGAFLVQAVLLLGIALSARPSEPRAGHGPMARVGVVIGLYGLVGQPAIAGLAGPGWRAAEVFGLHPDPTAVATLGLLMVAGGGFRVGVAAIAPVLWLQVASLTLIALGDARAWLLVGVVGLALSGGLVEVLVRRAARG